MDRKVLADVLEKVKLLDEIDMFIAENRSMRNMLEERKQTEEKMLSRMNMPIPVHVGKAIADTIETYYREFKKNIEAELNNTEIVVKKDK